MSQTGNYKSKLEPIMYSAESTLQDINDVDELQHKIDCIKQYGAQCAIQALKDASENCIVYTESRFPSVGFCECVPKFDKESITNVEIKLP